MTLLHIKEHGEENELNAGDDEERAKNRKGSAKEYIFHPINATRRREVEISKHQLSVTASYPESCL